MVNVLQGTEQTLLYRVKGVFMVLVLEREEIEIVEVCGRELENVRGTRTRQS
jgi:hypothetical protein